MASLEGTLKSSPPVGGLAGSGDAVVQPRPALLQLGQVPGAGPGTVVEPGEGSDNLEMAKRSSSSTWP